MANAPARSRFLTVSEVADLLRVSTMTVYRLIKAGELSAVRIGKSYRVEESAIDAYLANQYNAVG
jgi:excisionase family DNA binding protein